MKSLILLLTLLATLPTYAYVNYNSSNDANPNAYMNRIQQEQQQELQQQSQQNANQAAEGYYNHQTQSSYPNAGSPQPSR